MFLKSSRNVLFARIKFRDYFEIAKIRKNKVHVNWLSLFLLTLRTETQFRPKRVISLACFALLEIPSSHFFDT